MYAVAVYSPYSDTTSDENSISLSNTKNETAAILEVVQKYISSKTIEELEENFFELNDYIGMIEALADHNLHVSTPIRVNDAREELKNVMTPSEVELHFQLPKNLVSTELATGKLNSWEHKGFLRKSKGNWLIHKELATALYATRKKGLSAKYPRKINTIERINFFINNFEKYGLSKDTHYEFQFRKKLDIGGHTYHVIIKRGEHFYYQIFHSRDETSKRELDVDFIDHDELINVLYEYRDEITQRIQEIF